MLSDERQTHIRESLDFVEPEAKLRAIKAVADLQSPEELTFCANHYNWDDGFEIPTTIANHRLCDLEVALSLFWLAEAICWYTGEIKPNAYNADWVEFCRLVTDRVLRGEYPKGNTILTPQIGIVKYHKLRKAGVPDVLLTGPGD